jgi:DnaJ-class molecular chaperone
MDIRKNYYAILGVAPTADAGTVKAAFRALVKQYHPDTMTEGRPQAEARFREVNEAYKVLAGAQSRRAYDDRRRVAAANPQASDLNLDGAATEDPFTDLEVDALYNSRGSLD